MPVLLTVTFCAPVVLPTAVDAKVRLVGVTPAVGTPTPVPDRATLWVEPDVLLALSVMVIAPLLKPVAVGSNVTEMVQLDPAATEVEQVFVSA